MEQALKPKQFPTAEAIAVGIAAALTALCLTLSATPALASDGHAFSTSFNGGSEAEPGLAAPKGVAINQSTGNVYVVDSPTNEVQTLAVNATGGTFKLTFEGQTTAALPFNATAAELTTALKGLSTIGTGNVKVSGGPGGTASYTITFAGTLAEKRLPQITASAASLTPGGSTATTAIATVGGPGNDIAEFSEAGTPIRTFGSKGTGNGQFENPTEIAVANSGPNQGDVYVIDGGGNAKGANRVEVFSETGAYLSQVTKVEFQEVTSKELNQEGPAFLLNIALDSSGDLWILGENTTLVYELPVGGPLKLIFNTGIAAVPGFVITPGNELWWANGSGVSHKSSTGEALPGFGFSESPQATGLAVDLKSGHEGFYLDRGSVVAHFPIPTSNGQGPNDTFGSGTLAAGAGIAVNEANGKVYVADSTKNRIDVFTETTLPTVDLQAAGAIAQTSATLHGTVDPEGLAVSTCQFEYWRSGHPSEKQTASCSPAPGSGSSPVAVSATVSGLSPKTEYIVRLVATNANGTSTASEENLLKFKTLAPLLPLTVSKTGSGAGTVESLAPHTGIACSPTCSAEFEEGSEVELKATAAVGSEFTGFSGAGCSGTAATCKVKMSAAEEVTASFFKEGSPVFHKLTVSLTGEGEIGADAGTISGCTSSGGPSCEGEYEEGAQVTLTETPGPNAEFAGWQTPQCDESIQTICTIKIGSGDEAVAASFKAKPKPKFKLTVSKTGSGTVTSTPAGINCGSGSGCEAEYEEGVEVELHQSPASGSEFKEWSGACTGTGTCRVTMGAAKAVGAVFAPIPRTLAIARVGTGTGEVKCKVNGGSSEACAASYPNATALEVIATANAGSSFAGYSAGTGSATGCTASPCAFTIEADSEVTATFNLKPIPKFKLKVKRTGTGTGKVESTSPPSPRIDCGSECEAEFEEGTKVTLARSASAGSKFIEWGGACSGTGTCEVTMSAAREVTARFDLVPKFKLTISKSGTGTGKVTSAPSGIDCGLICSAEYEEGKEVELKEAASAGSEFVKWTGACSEASTCKVTMSAAKEVTAEFKLLPKPKFKLTISKSGTGTGTVTSSPPGISCGSTCSAEYEEGKEVELKEAASAGSEFTEWSGACTGTGACRVTMSAARSVGARFDAVPTFTLSVSRLGTGAGTVTSSPAGIECGEACAAEFEEGTEVELLATPEEGSEFKEWAGACTGTGACRVRMNAARSVRAVFRATPTYKLTVAKSGTGQGTVRSAPPIEAIDCGTTCEARLALGTEVELIATPDPGSEFFKWSGACTGNGPCEVTMSAARTAHATFKEVPRLKLSVTRSGPGTVTSSPPGISCGSECEHEYGPGTAIALSATPARGYRLKALTGCDSVAGSTCTVRMSAPRVVGATFVLARCKKGFRKEKVNGKARCVHRRHTSHARGARNSLARPAFWP